MKSIFKAVALITFFTVITRLLGFFFRVYLSREIGAEALGIFQVALVIFMVLVTLVSSGLPLVISKISSRLHIKGEVKKERAMITTALILSTLVATVACLIIFIFNRLLNAVFTDERCIVLLIILLPAVIFSAIYSTFRGWFWGHSNYFGLCISELFEQIVRIIICVIMLGGAITLMDGAITAAASLSIACLCSAGFVTVLYFVYGGRLAKPKGFSKELMKSSAPITSVRMASSLIQPLIAIIIPLRLVSAGMSASEAISLYGIAIGMTLPFLFIPSALIGSLGVALVPDLSAAVTQQDTNHVKNRISSSIILTMFISCFFVPLYMGAGNNIGLFFYNNAISGQLLVYSAWIMIPIGITNITSAILNALGCEVKSMKNYLIGSVLMLIAMWFLPQFIGINAIVIAMGICLSVSAFLNIRMINKVSSSKINIKKQLVSMLLCSIPVASLTNFITSILNHFLPLFFNLAISCSLGAVFFLTLCQVFNIIDIKVWVLGFAQKFKKKKHIKV
ncbi:MAG: oligosaccharide flippase family protein [Clostridia bacterium]|nr:oligosaccharide flippase family protein [Clostridia bacterium]